MFTNGSKYFIGVTGFSAAVLVIYLAVVDGAVGGAVALTSIMLAVGLLAGLALFNHDGDVQVGDSSAPANAEPVGSSLWPLVSTLGVVLLGIGLITHEIVFLLGLVALVAGFVEWVIQGWSESASSDRAYNASVRGRLIHPLEFPILATVGAGVLVVSFSRIMLAISKTAGSILFIVVGTLVLVGGVVFAVRPNLKKSVAVALCAVGAVGIVAGGIAGASAGKRDQLVKANEEDHFAHKECGEEKSKYFDFNAEAKVSMRSNPLATIEFVDGKLQARELGLPNYTSKMTVQKSNDISVIFRNETEGEHRLTLFYGEKEVQEGVVEELHNCTQMIEKGEEQILTFRIDKPSIASEKPYKFYVPGVEDQSIEVVVP
jgi:hypothetical protein